ncbi:MAG: MerR family transcriptional regulator, partial [Pseudomonadota bacterium]|nr:MerR family transcriptional regulator [Pseudomonadota bacterium]
GGRRYYRPDDIAVLTRIRDLLYKDGFTIRGAQRFLKSKEALVPTDALSVSAVSGNLPDLAPIQALLESARDRLVSVKSKLHP